MLSVYKKIGWISLSLAIVIGSAYEYKKFASADISTGLVNYYTFEEGAGTTITDSVSGGTATMIGVPEWVPGKSSAHALNFNTDPVSRLDMGPAPALKGASAFTIAMWVKFDSLEGVSEGLAGQYLNSANYTLTLGRNKGTIECQVRTSSTAKATKNFTNDTGIWHLVACVYDGSNVTVYVDGVAGTPVAQTGTTPMTSANLSVGGSGHNIIDDFRLYSRALSSSDISELYSYSTNDIYPPNISSVAVTPTANTATIEWVTDEISDTQVEYGKTSEYGSMSPLDSTLSTNHEVVLSGLDSGETYHYRVLSRDAAGNLRISPDATFTTVTTFRIDVATMGEGFVQATGITGLSCGENCSKDLIDPGTEVVLHAYPAPGYRFTGWSGDSCSGTDTCTITMSENHDVIANFTPGGVSYLGNSITKKVATVDFTWQFNCGGRQCTYGKFVNGDYWVVPIDDLGNNTGVVTITNILPDFSVDAEGNTYSHGAEVNPKVVGGKVGIISLYPDLYDQSRDIMHNMPYNAVPGDSIFKAFVVAKDATPSITLPYRLNGGSGFVPRCRFVGCIGSNDVLTVLSEIPENNGLTVFRPPFSGTWKPLFTTDDINLERIPSISAVSAMFDKPYSEIVAETLFGQSVAHYVGRGFGGEFYRELSPSYAMENYARDQARAIESAIFRTFGTEPLYQKIPIIYAIVQKGIDKYAMFRDGVAFGSGAGQHLGHKPPMVFFAALQSDAQILNKVREAATDPLLRGYFQEDTQVFRNRFGVPIWGDTARENYYWSEVESEWKYWNGYGGSGAVGGRGDPYGYIDGGSGNSNKTYQAVASGALTQFAFNQLMMPWYRYANGYDALIEYVDRLRGYETGNFQGGWWGSPDPCAGRDIRESLSCDPFRGTGCLYYKVTWGPDPDNPGQCLLHSDNPDTTLDGRWTQYHGYTKASGSGASGDFGNLWNNMRDCLNPSKLIYGTGVCSGMGPAGPDGNPTLDPPTSAVFKNINTLTIQKTGTGTGTVTGRYTPLNCGSVCSLDFPLGSGVRLTATPDEGSYFVGWSGGTCRDNGTCSPLLTADRTVVAEFALGTPSHATAPTVVSDDVTSITSSGGLLNGAVTSSGGAPVTVRGFQYGTTPFYGSNTVNTGSFGNGPFTAALTGLACDTEYYVRSYATNVVGTVYGEGVTFITNACSDEIPPVTGGGGSGGQEEPAPETPPVTGGGGNGGQEEPAPSTGSRGGGGGGGGGTSTDREVAVNREVAVETSSDDPAEIAVLMGSVDALRAQLESLISTTSAVSLPTNESRATPLPTDFFRDLRVDMEGQDVLRLQLFLNSNGFVIASSGPGSPGSESTYFGNRLQDALRRFQAANGIEATGYFGPQTRGIMNARLATPNDSGGNEDAAELEALIMMVGVLQKQLDALVISRTAPVPQDVPVPMLPVTSSQTPSVGFTRDLHADMEGQDVLRLQLFLNSNGFVIASSGPGSPGSESTYFGNRLQDALRRFQAANGIEATGYFGPQTRATIEGI